MPYNLFLDDYRVPIDCVSYMHQRIGKKNPIYLYQDWQVVKNYEQFVNCITHKGMPEVVSFDNDLCDEHYVNVDIWEGQATNNGFIEKTGYDCLKWLIQFCIDTNQAAPECFFHTANLAAYENMISFYATYKKMFKTEE